MVFNSFSFILIFMPILAAGYFALNRFHKEKAAQVFLILMSLVFYGFFGIRALIVLGVSIVINLVCSHVLRKLYTQKSSHTAAPEAGEDNAAAESNDKGTDEIKSIEKALDKRRSVVLAAGVMLNLLLLAVFKYGQSFAPGSSLIMPVGLSFYTFSQISFLVDTYRGELQNANALDEITWITYFPKLIEGPIARYDEIVSQFHDKTKKTIDPENFMRGLALFIFGMGKKILIADRIAPAVNYGFSAMYLDTVSMTAVIISYAIQLYMDFSGFCDMGMGLGRMLGIDLPLNFDSPYKEKSFGTLWQKWHMTLTRFFTKYVYIPFGGSRKGTFRTCINIMIIFILSGLWHGNGWTYLSWGAICGALAVVFHLFFNKKIRNVSSKAGTAALRALTMVIFCFTLFFFRADTVGNAILMIRRLFVFMGIGWLPAAAAQISYKELYPVEKAAQLISPQFFSYLKTAEYVLLIVISLVLIYGKRNARELSETMTLRRRNAVILSILFIWCMISMTGVSTYLYFKY